MKWVCSVFSTVQTLCLCRVCTQVMTYANQTDLLSYLAEVVVV